MTIEAISNETINQAIDARIAAYCLSAGVTELWTVDRDFRRFPALRVSLFEITSH